MQSLELKQLLLQDNFKDVVAAVGADDEVNLCRVSDQITFRIKYAFMARRAKIITGGTRKIREVLIMTDTRPKICGVSDSRMKIMLASNPEFVCDRCGNRAHSKITLCEPIPLEPDH
jgi:hypothetical protein